MGTNPKPPCSSSLEMCPCAVADVGHDLVNLRFYALKRSVLYPGQTQSQDQTTPRACTACTRLEILTATQPPPPRPHQPPPVNAQLTRDIQENKKLQTTPKNVNFELLPVPASSAPGSLSATGCVVTTFPGGDSVLLGVDLPTAGDSLKILLILKEKSLKYRSL